MYDRDDIFIAEQDFIEGQWPHIKPYGPTVPLTDQDFENIFQIMLCLCRVKYVELPEYFRQHQPTLKGLLAQQWLYLDAAVGKLISRQKADALEVMMRKIGWHAEFVHYERIPALQHRTHAE